MNDFKALEETCQQNSELSRSVIDEFLIYYAAQQDNLEKELKKRLTPYRHITSELQKSWVNMMKAQYLSHRIFRQGGLIKKYLNHSALKNLDSGQEAFLKQQMEYPWRFSFSIIDGNPHEDFYEMIDVFSDEHYLLYSPGVTKTLNDQNGTLWFNLLSFNGGCWQTNGPIIAYNGFEADDIFFFTTELYPNKWFENDEDILLTIEQNPIPYLMLITGANMPLVFNNKEDQIAHVMAEYDKDSFDATGLREDFELEYSDEVYRLSLKEWSNPPHYSTAYYDELEQLLLLSSMTDRGFQALVEALKKHGYELHDEPGLRVNPSMVETTRKILRKEIMLNEYEGLFKKDIPDEDSEYIDKLNTLMEMALPDINAGKEPDAEALSKKSGIDVKEVREFLQQIIIKLKDIDDPRKESE